MNSIDKVTLTVAAICHDVGHPGRNNQFFINCYDPLVSVGLIFTSKTPVALSTSISKLLPAGGFQSAVVSDFLVGACVVLLVCFLWWHRQSFTTTRRS